MKQMVAERQAVEYSVKGLDVWVASLEDRPGALAEKLLALKDAGVDLEFVVARRSQSGPGSGVVFVTPLRGDQEIEAAVGAGFNVSRSLHVVRVEGSERPGFAVDLTAALAAEGISLGGFSSAVAGTRFLAYIAFDSLADKDHAISILTTG